MKVSNDLDSLIDRFKKKDKIALAKLITIIENEPEKAHEVFKHFEDVKHDSYIIGITGSSGVGKSTLTGEICKHLLEEGKKIGII
ncbi:MAG: methylmalonyl Co-A mutase-associated GTPase MeaB, partial [Candidatus Lokiarchaeota archaeon]|nr:methylmalonyl Co-A mutase-associated GTPase MeaB [Candidatus Lokiarchaeota archaeon]